MRTFEFSDAKSHKFWNIDVQGNAFTVTYGKIGTAGRSQTKKFKSAASTQAEADKLIKEKIKKGYVEMPKGATAESLALEAALRDTPDDFAGWCAYADYLAERGDPRGEFMQVQLALEDESRRKKEREALKEKEKELLKEHEREWLGGLAPFAFGEGGREEEGVEYQWSRGFVSRLVAKLLSMALAQTLALDPALRFVKELHVHGILGDYGPNQPKPLVKTPKGGDVHWELFELLGSPFLANLRVFQMGDQVPEEDGWCDRCYTYTPDIVRVIADMPRVEVLNLYCKAYESAELFKLPNLTHLRELRIYHLGGYYYGRRYEYALDELAKNPAFANLTHLLFHPHQPEKAGFLEGSLSYLPLEQVKTLIRSPYLKKLTHLQLRLTDMGDDGIREIIASGILKQLRWLDLRHGAVTDEGAKLLAACPDAKRLERIDLSRNGVSSKGLAVLRKAKVNAVANNPLTQTQLDEQHYFREGDFE